MRNAVLALMLGLAVGLVGCKDAAERAAAPPTTTATATDVEEQAQPSPAGHQAGAKETPEFEELVITVEIPGCTPEEWAASKDKSHGGRGCPMKDSSAILGVTISSPHGIVISEVVPGSPADKAGLKKGDSIVACNGNPTSCPSVLRPMITPTRTTRVVKLTVRRQKAAETAAEPEGKTSAQSESAE